MSADFGNLLVGFDDPILRWVGVIASLSVSVYFGTLMVRQVCGEWHRHVEAVGVMEVRQALARLYPVMLHRLPVLGQRPAPDQDPTPNDSFCATPTHAAGAPRRRTSTATGAVAWFDQLVVDMLCEMRIERTALLTPDEEDEARRTATIAVRRRCVVPLWLARRTVAACFTQVYLDLAARLLRIFRAFVVMLRRIVVVAGPEGGEEKPSPPPRVTPHRAGSLVVVPRRPPTGAPTPVARLSLADS